ncbi:unnamed protein product [Rotaria sp. Silwood2]|nr:unnamed protein product [Rotaria sp. Silwood2]CAF3083049.1 unnamed protein product [Rotaria sp. Silwood2]CAF4279440.1 unnamed protein product [Rotaria sp. Silwood2]CAF4431143.1 unnamed protein product [Rotaria sp. Silwood2]
MGTKSSKPNLRTIEPLSRQTIEELCRTTGFAEEELLAWHENFYKDCPDGRLTLKQFEQEYAKIMGKPTQKTADYIRHMFNVYDEDKSQYIDFKEFVMALSAASAVNRLRLIETLFHVFDLDNDGKITKEEIGKMLHTLIDVTDSNNKHNNPGQQERTKQISLQQRIDDAFNELNANDDDYITKDEFIDWYMKSGLISDVQTEELNAPDPARIQKIGKKSRKIIKQAAHGKSHHEQDDNRAHHSHIVRHMSRMTERKSSSKYDDDDYDDNHNNYNNYNNNLTTVSSMNYNDDDIDDDRTLNNPTRPVTGSIDDSDLQYSKENERWQHLFNSVLGQIRSQRLKDQPINKNETNNIKSWKREGEEKTKSEYMRQKVNGREGSSYISTTNIVLQPPKKTSDERSPSPDIITIRL